MDYTDYYERLKLRLVLLNMISMLNVIDLCVMQDFINDLTDDNIEESLHKLYDIDLKNKVSLKRIVDDIKRIEITGELFCLTDILDTIELISENYDIENYYFLNIVNYLIMLNDYSINGEELVLSLDEFLNNSDTMSNNFNENYKQLEKIREER